MKFPVRLEKVAGTSAKFYVIDVKGSSIITTWGRLGSDGKSKTINKPGDKHIALDAELMVLKKEREGYVRIIRGLEPTLKVGRKAKVAGDTSGAATPSEIKAIAKAVASHKSKLPTKRFKIRWDEGFINGGTMDVGDPAGTTIVAENLDGANWECMFWLSEPNNEAAGEMFGLRLSTAVAVVWQRYQPFTIKKLFGGWYHDGFKPSQLKKPGLQRTKSYHRGWLFKAKSPGTYDSIVGLDAHGKPAVLMFGPNMRVELFASVLTERPEGARDPFLPPDTTATEKELAALAKAIDKRKKAISKRFHLEAVQGTVKPVDGKLVFGDPKGPHEVFDAGTSEAVTFTQLIDEKTYDDGYGKSVIIARLRGGEPVTWTVSTEIEMKSGYFGFWSPGYPTSDITDEGPQTHGQLGANIHSCRSTKKDGPCSTLVGLNKQRRPVCIVFGHELETETFARGIS